MVRIYKEIEIDIPEETIDDIWVSFSDADKLGFVTDYPDDFARLVPVWKCTSPTR